MKIPEETAVIDNPSSIRGGAIPDLGHGGGVAGHAIRLRHVISALHHGVDRVRRPGLLRGGKPPSAAAGELGSEVGEGGVEVVEEVRYVGSIILAATLIQQINLRLRIGLSPPRRHGGH